MSALDRALIKAYRRQLGDSIADPAAALALKPVKPRSFHRAEHAHAGPHRKPTISAETESPLSVESGVVSSDWTTFRVDVGVTGVPTSPSFLSTADVEAELIAERAPIAAPPLVPEPVHPAVVHLTSRSPAPAAMVESVAEQPARQAEFVPPLQPQLVVDQFGWPTICDDLTSSARDNWRTFLESFHSQAGHARALAFVGIEAGAGCSTTLLCLARQLAASGKKVVLVDANFIRPCLAESLSINVVNGWDAAFAGKIPLEETLVESLEDHLTLAPLAASDKLHPAISHAPRAASLWQSLRQSFDIVLFDAGSLDAATSCGALGRLCDAAQIDGAYLICDTRSTTPQEIVGMARQLKDHHIHLYGAIENFSGIAAGGGDH